MCFGDDARPPLPPIIGGPSTVTTWADGTEVRGLHGFYEELAQRFAEAGVYAVAITSFGRTAGTGPRVGDFPLREHVDKLDLNTVGEGVSTVGFCLGGAMS